MPWQRTHVDSNIFFPAAMESGKGEISDVGEFWDVLLVQENKPVRNMI